MAKGPEAKLKERVMSALHALPNTWCVKIQQVAIRGTPDILACIRGRFFGIELKSDEGELSTLQEYNLQQIAEAGGVGLVILPANWLVTFTKLRKYANGSEPDYH